MALDLTKRLQPERSDPLKEAAPLAGTRAQAVQRLQVGLFGLAAMILIVGLASIINSNAEQNAAAVVPEAAPTIPVETESAAARDPMADAGVVPDMPASGTPAAGRAADVPPPAQP